VISIQIPQPVVPGLELGPGLELELGPGLELEQGPGLVPEPGLEPGPELVPGLELERHRRQSIHQPAPLP
jgi:hypothetical protein